MRLRKTSPAARGGQFGFRTLKFPQAAAAAGEPVLSAIEVNLTPNGAHSVLKSAV